MIQVYSKNSQDLKVLKKVTKKLNISEENVLYASYDTFFFSFVYALAIKEGRLHLYGEDENHKKTKKPISIPIFDIEYAFVEKNTDLNLLLKDGKFINLTSVVGVTKGSSKILNELNAAIKEAKAL